MTTSDITPEAVRAGQAVYTPAMLRIYDLWVLGVSNRFIWCCPTPALREWYHQHLSGCHLDIGVGTGYFMDRCRFPVKQPELALLDLNPNSLAATAARIARYSPTVFQQSVFEPWALQGRLFDSVGMNYLLHCLPGEMDSKQIVFQHAAAALRPGGVLFGSTLLGRELPRGLFARKLMAFYNRKGIFCNQQDSLTGLRDALSPHFKQVEIKTLGCAALFAARR